MANMNQQVIDEFRANEGRVGGHFANNTLLILHTTGAKSGKERVNPLVTYEDDGRLVIVASKGGSDTHPHWYHNIAANPVVGVEYGTEVFKARAAITEEPERTELYEKMEKQMAAFTNYKNKVSRVIPVITLTRIQNDQG